MSDIIWLIDTILAIYLFFVIIWVVASWLVNFGIVNPRSPIVHSLLQGLDRLIDPVLRPIRRILPDLGGLDLSPLIVILLITFLRRLLWTSFGPF